MQFFTKKHQGFTLIELLVVIAIIGILASIVLVSLGGARSKARDAQRQADLHSILTAQEMYYGDAEAYLTSGAAAGTSTVPAIGTYVDAMTDYMWVNNDYTITDCTAGEFYCAYADLENGDWFAVSEKGAKEVAAEPAYGASDCLCW